MKKVAILTLNGYHNYGNRLQNYATQEALKSLGFNVETIIIDTKAIDGKNKKSRIVNRFHNLEEKTIKAIIHKINIKTWEYMHKEEIKKRKVNRNKVFRKFTSDNILETKIENKIISDEISNCYDYFITGSDQVWNPFYISDASIYFLTFAPYNKRIAFSPSFGISQIPCEFEDDYRKWLMEMGSLSVREEAGAKIIKDLTGRDAPVLVDPTLLLSTEKWLSISKEALNKPKEKFLLTYFLGDITPKYRNTIQIIAKKNKLTVISLSNIRECETYQTGPAEFIDYIHSASLLCTDSFHGVVFSILMETPFIIFDRKSGSLSMYSRIDTLLRTFKLESRKAINVLTNEQVLNIDYSHIPEIIEIERNKALSYLNKALHIKGKN